MGLHADQAGAAHRGMLVAAAIAATLGAHAAIGGGRPGPMTLMVAVTVVSAVCRVPGRSRPWRRSSLLRLAALGLLLQVAVHFGINAAPWAFGMGIDAQDAVSLPVSVLVHLVAGATLAVLCWFGEMGLDALVLLARRVGRHLGDGPRAGCGTAWLRLRGRARIPGRSAGGRPISRGPPVALG